MKNKTALLMVDLQNDFCPGGNLAVPEGDSVIPLANQLQKEFNCVVATKDWHPRDHVSFASNHPGHSCGDRILLDQKVEQILWPDHCLQDSQGAEFHPDLDISHVQRVFYKGVDKTIDSYSAFFDNAHLRATGLGDYLRAEGITHIVVLGLATDYCVKYSVLDALHLGFTVTVIVEACRGVELNPGDVARAIAEMRAAGARISNQ